LSTLARFLALLLVALIVTGCGHPDNERGKSPKTTKPRLASRSKASSAAESKKDVKVAPKTAQAQTGGSNIAMVPGQLSPFGTQPQPNPFAISNQSKALPGLEGNSLAPAPVPKPVQARPTPQQLLGVMRQVYSRIGSIKLEGVSQVLVKYDGKAAYSTGKENYSLAFSRANGFRLVSGGTELICDGKTVYQYSRRGKVYVKTKMSKDVMLGLIKSKPGVGSIGLLMGIDYTPAIASMSLKKDEIVNNKKTFVLVLRLKNGMLCPPDAETTQTLYIGQDNLVVYRNRIVIVGKPKRQEGYTGKIPHKVETTIVSDLVRFTPNPKLPSSMFAFHPPAGARLWEAPKDVDLTGKPAPDFSYKAPDGTEKKLSDLRGQVVVLSFWALPMAEKQLPAIKSLSEHPVDGVQLVAINLNADRRTVDEMLEKKGGIFPYVSGDEKIGEMAFRDYSVRRLPTTLIIDKEGIVRAVMPGPVSEDDIRAKLEKLVL
jgi:peroxiredoxin/outer membrane lipoprotein-sorting protein